MASASSRPWIRRAALALVLAACGFAGFGRSEAADGAAGPALSDGMLKALPQNTNMIYRIRPAALLASSAFRRLDVPGLLMAQAEIKELPFPVEQIAEFLVGGPMDGEPTLMAKLAIPVVEGDFIAKLKGEKRPEPVQGRAVYTLKEPELEIALLSPTEILGAEDPDSLAKALAARAGEGKPCDLAREIAGIDAPIAAVLKDFPIPGDPEKTRIARATLAVKAGETLDISAEIQMEKPEQAEAFAGMLKAQIGEFKKQAVQQLKELLELPAPPSIAALENLKISTDGKTVTIRTEVTVADLDLAKKAVDKFIRQALEAKKAMQP